MLNWHKVEVDKGDLTVLPETKNVYEPKELIGTLKTFCLTKNITLKIGNKPIEELFTCKDPEFNPILIVFAADLHKVEENNMGYPISAFIQLMLLYQTGPQFVLTGSTTNMNLYMGTSIRNSEYGAHKTFDKYMHHNVNNKLIPVHREDGKPGVLLRKLRFHSYYTTMSSVAQNL